ncbi:MAG: hypothetical protein K2O22_05475, partial [Anaeroplasmataceae bacterium]|nr:hypothetical protein [Anaeroplasmataceae bacterium]
NSFDDSSWEYENFHIQGRVSLIALLEREQITIKFASVSNQKLFLSIDGYECVKTDVTIENDTFIVEDYFEHKIIYRRKL